MHKSKTIFSEKESRGALSFFEENEVTKIKRHKF